MSFVGQKKKRAKLNSVSWHTMPLFMVIPAGQKLGPLNGPNCIPKDPPVEPAWGTFDGASRRRVPACVVCECLPRPQQQQRRQRCAR